MSRMGVQTGGRVDYLYVAGEGDDVRYQDDLRTRGFQGGYLTKMPHIQRTRRFGSMAGAQEDSSRSPASVAS